MSKRLIYAEDAIDALAKGNWGVEWDKALAEAIIKNVPSAQPKKTQLSGESTTKDSTFDCISRQMAIDEIDVWIEAFKENGHRESASDAHFIRGGIGTLPPAQPDKRLEKIADLVDGTIDHFDRDDAMDLLYQIKEVLNER